MLCVVLEDKTYSGLNLSQPNNLEIAKHRMKEHRHERRIYRSITYSLKN